MKGKSFSIRPLKNIIPLKNKIRVAENVIKDGEKEKDYMICQSKKQIRLAGDVVHDHDKGVDYTIQLPDELLENIFGLSPIPTIIRATSVCKRWHRVIHSGLHHTNVVPHNPWYFTSTLSSVLHDVLSVFHDVSAVLHDADVFDSALDKWYNIPLPKYNGWGYVIASSFGLLCLILRDDPMYKICLGNPITEEWKLLPRTPFESLDDRDIALSTNRESHEYIVTIVHFAHPATVSQERITLSIHVYESVTNQWSMLHSQDVECHYWKQVTNSVICNDILYFVIDPHPRLLIMYDLASRCSEASPIECPFFIWGKLMNLGGRLLLVGLCSADQPWGWGVRIWQLQDKSWHEVSRMPTEFCQGKSGTRPDFACRDDGPIFFRFYRDSRLIIFDIMQTSWSCIDLGRKSHSVYFESFCLEPRLDVSP